MTGSSSAEGEVSEGICQSYSLQPNPLCCTRCIFMYFSVSNGYLSNNDPSGPRSRKQPISSRLDHVNSPVKMFLVFTRWCLERRWEEGYLPMDGKVEETCNRNGRCPHQRACGPVIGALQREKFRDEIFTCSVRESTEMGLGCFK